MGGGLALCRARPEDSVMAGMLYDKKAILAVLPPIPDDAPEHVKDGIAIRNACSLNGECPVCGTVGVVHEDADMRGLWHITFQHEDWCPVYRDAA